VFVNVAPSNNGGAADSMKAELKQKWVEALRSGKYEQGRLVLKNTEGHMCCLGVLLDIEAPAGWSACATEIPGEVGHYGHQDGNFCGDFLHLKTRERHGLTSELDDGESIAHRLAHMNDNGRSFAEIADWIEREIPADESVQP
jgi:hypothetical protein